MKRNTQHEVRENLPLLCAENQTFGSYLKANEGEVACFLLFYVLENRRWILWTNTLFSIFISLSLFLFFYSHFLSQNSEQINLLVRL